MTVKDPEAAQAPSDGGENAKAIFEGVKPTAHESDSDADPNAQAGVKNIEAFASVWSNKALWITFVFIWIIFFINSLQESVSGTLLPYVTSAFEQHSLTPTVGIMSNIIGGVVKLTLAKVIDIWGRPLGYIISIVFTTMGLIMMAACNTVETYAAAQVFYWVGANGILYVLDVFLADTTTLKNRSLIYAFASSPYLITTWIAGPMSSSILSGPGFRWGYGIFAIVIPAITTPLYFVFWHFNKKAKKLGLVTPRESHGTAMQSILHYCRELDVIGLLLISGGLAMFLLPFSIYSYQAKGWDSSLIIGLLVGGFVTTIAFGVWEKWFAPVTIIPYNLLMDRTVIGCNMLAASVFVSFYIWDSYFFSFLQVVNNLNVTQATYVSNTYTMGSCSFAFIVGYLIRYTGRIKWLCLYFGVPVTILGVGLMLKFRQPDVDIGYVVMCQIFIAFAGGTIVICEQTAIMAATSHQYIAIVLAIESMASYVGGAIGQTIAAAIWTGVFPKKLAHYLPETAQANLTEIYGSLEVQLSYPIGSPTRIAIQQAYGDAQKMMVIAATAVLAFALIGTAMWRDYDVRKHKQTKGTVW